MDVRLTEERVEIARQARRFLEKETPADYVRAMFDDERGFREEVWVKMAEMGWTAMLIPEAYGGLDMEFVDIAVVLEEMGRAALPGPFFSTALLAAPVVLEAGTDAQKERYLPRIASGELKGAFALQEPDGGADPEYVAMRAAPDGEAYVLDGVKLFVPDAHVADFMVCAARLDGPDTGEAGVGLFLIDLPADGVTVTPIEVMDRTRKVCSVEFSKVRVDPAGVLGAPHRGMEYVRTVLRRAQAGLAAECVGGAAKALDIAVDYAKIRVQFDQPIGSFQAIKHRCSRMFQDVESSRSIMYWAAWAQDHGTLDEAVVSAHAAKSYSTNVYYAVAADAVQILGGTGFSWEHDIHLYFKRAKANEIAFGDPSYHRERIAGMLADGRAIL